MALKPNKLQLTLSSKLNPSADRLNMPLPTTSYLKKDRVPHPGAQKIRELLQ
jgi:hypothetical protein